MIYRIWLGETKYESLKLGDSVTFDAVIPHQQRQEKVRMVPVCGVVVGFKGEAPTGFALVEAPAAS